MIGSSDSALTFPAKLNRLFDVYRSRDQAEQSADDVARSVSQIIGRPVSGNQIHALRHDGATIPDADIIRGLITHFGVPADYLASTGPQAEHLDKQLRLLAAARDAGVKRLALRGGVAIDDLDSMLEVINKVPPEVP
ncbi:hypothetical protein MHAE_15354 [Mycobacterium haemophilum DSM 44634]|uniref:hypothetical protein n=1 Tax=Mycobacterium haemophilum TaxID=29311 RepID=UPI0006D3FAE4|nr:hypothetical protein [Mycobacterium haemophilum]ALL56297.1 hypothetical protein B586_20125 [Mycobacterium haemophilum DSM 44634]MCV7339398.1 hypothetical protein [Mycobacterium haemophilum DSM 44634]